MLVGLQAMNVGYVRAAETWARITMQVSYYPKRVLYTDAVHFHSFPGPANYMVIAIFTQAVLLVGTTNAVLYSITDK